MSDFLLDKQALRAAFEPARGGSERQRSWLKPGAGAPFVKYAVFLCAGLTMAVLLFMMSYILVKGLPFFSDCGPCVNPVCLLDK